jgi:hypothetical protein
VREEHHPNNSDLPDFVYYQDGDPGRRPGENLKPGERRRASALATTLDETAIPSGSNANAPPGNQAAQ